MDYEVFAKQIISLVGGSGNIAGSLAGYEPFAALCGREGRLRDRSHLGTAVPRFSVLQTEGYGNECDSGHRYRTVGPAWPSAPGAGLRDVGRQGVGGVDLLRHGAKA